MKLQSYLNAPGEHLLLIDGPDGQIEAILTVPPTPRMDTLAVLGHPHSLQGGSMSNKVVTSMARVFKDAHIIALRFNFRGVGRSGGVYDAGIGESEDMLFLARLLIADLDNPALIFAGFSFGSYVAYRAASQLPHRLLISVAPAVHHYNYHEFTPPGHWVVLQGEVDEVVPFDLVQGFVQKTKPQPQFICFPETGHFFHGQLIALKEALAPIVAETLQ